MEHLTPAQKHWQKTMAERRGENETERTHAELSAYENMLHRLRADKSQLSNIQGNDRKAEYKMSVLPNYQAWIDGVLESKTGVADEVFITTMIWFIDAGLYAEALKMADYAIQFNLPLPDNYNRTLATVIVDEICDWSLTVKASGKQDEVIASLNELIELERITAQSDMPDGARAKLYKVIGLTLKEDEKQKAAALDYLQRAILADKDVGVKKDIEQLLRALSKQDKTSSEDKKEEDKTPIKEKPAAKKGKTPAAAKGTKTSSKKAAKS